MISLICGIFKKKKRYKTYIQNRPTDTENKFMVPKGEQGAQQGINYESGKHTHFVCMHMKSLQVSLTLCNSLQAHQAPLSIGFSRQE